MLVIKDLHVAVDGKKILNGVNLTVNAGEVHAIMGPNGAGKSTLSAVIAAKPGYEITQGEIRFMDQDIAELLPEERAHLGVFLGFQYPVEVPGVNNAYFLKMAVNHQRKQRGLEEYDAVDFLSVAKAAMARLEMPEDFLHRSVNVGFSGGEKKRNEILQMLLLEPKLAILDETDSGLDIDALQVVARGVNHCRHSTRSFLLITHYQRLLDYIEPDFVHVLKGGKIIKSGDKALALTLEQSGYSDLMGEV